MTSAPPLAASARTLLTALAREETLTRPFLERLPDDKFDWQPHPKSRSLGHLASHLADLLGNVKDTLATPSFDLALEGEFPQPATSRAEVLVRFAANVASARAALATTSEAALAHRWTFYHGEQIIFSQPRAQIVRELLLDHLIHHRAQLGVYLRLLDIPVPGTYGPTADEPEFDFDFATANANV